MNRQHRVPILRFPELVLHEIVAELDYESKYHLAQTSTCLKKYIESKKVSYDSVDIILDSRIDASVESRLMQIRVVNGAQQDITTCYRLSERKTRIYKKRENVVTARTCRRSFLPLLMKQLEMLLWCPKTSIKNLRINDGAAKLTGYDNKNFCRLLRKMFRDLRFQLPVENFYMVTSDEQKLCAFLSFLKPGVLSTIKMSSPNGMIVKKALQMPQWREATTIRTFRKVQVLLNFEMRTPNLRTFCCLNLEDFKKLGEYVLDSDTLRKLELSNYIYDEQGILELSIPFLKDDGSMLYRYAGHGFMITAEIVEENYSKTLIIKKSFDIQAR